jgi:energy-coupling factor transporter ATP-binding protein EcfA2
VLRRKTHGTKLTILDGLSGVLRPGRYTLLLGPPGAGKSVLLKALAGKVKAEEGLRVSKASAPHGVRKIQIPFGFGMRAFPEQCRLSICPVEFVCECSSPATSPTTATRLRPLTPSALPPTLTR